MKKRTYEASNAAKRQICTVLKELMTQKPLNRITVAEIMRGCGMARQHFYYHFDDVYDAVRWIFEEEAVELLLTQNEKTYVIAEKVGYTDPNYFSYVFKKKFGVSPSKYRASGK